MAYYIRFCCVQAGGFRAGQTINALVTLITALGMAFFYGWKLALLLLVAVPLITAGAYQQTSMLRKHQQRDAKYMDNAGRVSLCVAGIVQTFTIVHDDPLCRWGYQKNFNMIGNEVSFCCKKTSIQLQVFCYTYIKVTTLAYFSTKFSHTLRYMLYW